MSRLKVEIITPEQIAFNEEADFVVMPTVDGEIDVLPGHIPLMTLAKPGELKVSKAGNLQYMAVGRGVIQVVNDTISILTDMAVWEHDIDIGQAEEALKRAEEAMKKKDFSGFDGEAALQAHIMKQTALIKVKSRR
ncbi:ATP synthase F1 subunit epsilon [Kamptonema cortianum]|nr:ATP synthase F1 subunit epsilon [Oscillatoria laete-virens]MDK3160324.1 ATP synthase F1 subunit epsilon [Kamptonema cortianum]MDL5053707.1 ATP synthase F1 subunit epsilon [Oscillatoria laete-virens NRMC-F 0139]